MRLAITGASGFVGRRLLQRLAARSDEAIALVRRPIGEIERPRVTQVVRELGDLSPADMRGVDAVVHLAVTESQEVEVARRVNRYGTRSVASATLAADIPRFVHMSSAAIYDFAALGDITLNEDHPLVPHGIGAEPDGPYPSVYAMTKSEAEDEVRLLEAKGLSATILRPTGVLGAAPNSAWGTRVPRMLLEGAPFPRHDTNTFGFIGVDDLVDAVLLAVSAPDTTTANIVGGHVPFGDYLDGVERALPGQPSVPRANDLSPWKGSYDTTRMKNTLGLQPRQTFHELMDEIADYWRDQT